MDRNTKPTVILQTDCHGASFTASLESGSKNNGTCILWVTGKGVDEDRDYLVTTEKEFKTGTILGTCEEHERVVNGKLFPSPGFERYIML
jgi:hypothetical protein